MQMNRGGLCLLSAVLAIARVYRSRRNAECLGAFRQWRYLDLHFSRANLVDILRFDLPDVLAKICARDEFCQATIDSCLGQQSSLREKLLVANLTMVLEGRLQNCEQNRRSRREGN